MAHPQHLEFLFRCLEKKSGRKPWLRFKLHVGEVDLAESDFTDCNLRDYDLSDCRLAGAIFLEADLIGTDFSDADLSGADLRRANLRNACLDRIDGSRANLSEADLTDATLADANLREARLADANLTGADLSGVDLTEGDLRGASLKYARLTGARLARANVAQTNLTGAVLDAGADVEMLYYSSAVIEQRRYRKLRSRLKPRRAEPALEADEETPVPRAPQERVVLHQPAETEAELPAPTVEEVEEEIRERPGERTIPVREVEPDLSSVEGCCEVLGVTVGASTREIAKAFRAKAKLFHPDMVRHLSPHKQELAAREFRRVHKAYEGLTRQSARPLVGVVWAPGVPVRVSPYEYTIEEYERLREVNPNNPDLHYNLACKYFEEERFQDALAGFNRVLTLNPNDADAEYNIMITRLYLEVLLPERG